VFLWPTAKAAPHTRLAAGAPGLHHWRKPNWRDRGCLSESSPAHWVHTPADARNVLKDAQLQHFSNNSSKANRYGQDGQDGAGLLYPAKVESLPRDGLSEIMIHCFGMEPTLCIIFYAPISFDVVPGRSHDFARNRGETCSPRMGAPPSPNTRQNAVGGHLPSFWKRTRLADMDEL